MQRKNGFFRLRKKTRYAIQVDICPDGLDHESRPCTRLCPHRSEVALWRGKYREHTNGTDRNFLPRSAWSRQRYDDSGQKLSDYSDFIILFRYAPPSVSFRYLHQEDQKLFLYYEPSQQFGLLYDFGLITGDTLAVTIYEGQGNIFNQIFKVTDVQRISLGADSVNM